MRHRLQGVSTRPPRPARQVSLPFGHELAGTVSAVGKGVTSAKEGDRVVVANSAPMDDCYWCTHGQNHLCPALKLHNGAYGEYDLVPAHIVKHNLHPLKASTPFEIGAMAEPFSTTIHAAEIMDVKQNDSAMIIGAGPMSVMLVHALKARGARVAVLGRSKDHLRSAREAGAEKTFSTLDDGFKEDVRDWADKMGPQHVFEAVGKVDTHLLAVELVRNGGKVCLFGGCAPARPSRSTSTASTTSRSRSTASSTTRRATSRRPCACSPRAKSAPTSSSRARSSSPTSRTSSRPTPTSRSRRRW
ncbi:MAG: alcohol dehydrogenase catalytic domain-containing protein [Elusimicrobiota bacterium]|nr:MAG: alcohol dehydrogenase catalytic domain-containing protein [Elusimicrobiota bacterium]